MTSLHFFATLLRLNPPLSPLPWTLNEEAAGSLVSWMQYKPLARRRNKLAIDVLLLVIKL